MHAAERNAGHRIYAEIRDANNWRNRGDGVFDVPSGSSPGVVYHGVCVAPDDETCPCGRWRRTFRDPTRGHLPCRHHWAAYFDLDASGENPAALPIFKRGLASIAKEVKSNKRVRRKLVPIASGAFAHLAPSTRANKRAEIWPIRGPEMLLDLCQTVKEPVVPKDRRGPKSRSVREQCIAMVLKEFDQKSLRGMQGRLKDMSAAGVFERPPSVNSLARYRQNPARVKDLFKMFMRTAACVSEIETEYTVDSTGFSCTRTGNHADEKYYRRRSKEAEAALKRAPKKTGARSGSRRPSRFGAP